LVEVTKFKEEAIRTVGPGKSGKLRRRLNEKRTKGNPVSKADQIKGGNEKLTISALGVNCSSEKKPDDYAQNVNKGSVHLLQP